MSIRKDIQDVIQAARNIGRTDRMDPVERFRVQELLSALADFDAAEKERATWPEVRVEVGIADERGWAWAGDKTNMDPEDTHYSVFTVRVRPIQVQSEGGGELG